MQDYIGQPRIDFSYLNKDEVDQSRMDKLAFLRGSIEGLIKKTALNIVKLGEYLIEAKSIIGHGNFTLWLEKEFGFHIRTAQNFMNVAQNFKSETVSHLKIAPKVLYLLAAPSTPEEVREEFVGKAQNGEAFSHNDVKNTIQEVKQDVNENQPENPPHGTDHSGGEPSKRENSPPPPKPENSPSGKPMGRPEKYNVLINTTNSLIKEYQQENITYKVNILMKFVSHLEIFLQEERDHSQANTADRRLYV